MKNQYTDLLILIMILIVSISLTVTNSSFLQITTNNYKIEQNDNPWTTSVEPGHWRTMNVTYCNEICESLTPLNSLITIEILEVNNQFITFNRTMKVPDELNFEPPSKVEKTDIIPRNGFYFTSPYISGSLSYPLTTTNVSYLKKTINSYQDVGRNISMVEDAGLITVKEFDWHEHSNYNDFTFVIDPEYGWVISMEIIIRNSTHNYLGEVHQKIIYGGSNSGTTLSSSNSNTNINTDTNSNQDSKDKNFTVFEYLLVLFLIPVVILLGGIFSRIKRKKEPLYETSFNSLLTEGPKNFLRDLYSKILIGLAKHETFLINQEDKLLIDQFKNLKPSKNGTTTIISNLYPNEIREEMTSELRGRSVLILVELAFQPDNKGYSKYLSQVLNIPPQTVTFELKRLMDLNYIIQIHSIESLADTRFKYYELTQKGIMFLYLLKETIAYSLILVNQEDMIRDTE